MYKRLFKEVPKGLVGIYKITNKITNKVYIGQSVDIRRRWNSHINVLNDTNKNEEEKSTALHQSMLKYGVDNFDFEIVELCAQSELNEKEQYWIKQYNSYLKGYNETIGGEAFQFRPEYVDEVIDLLQHTNKTYQEISEITGTSIQSIGNINRGLSFKDDSLNYPLRSWTHAVIQYSSQGVEINRFSSIAEASNATGITDTNIRSVCTHYLQGQKMAGGFQWRYIEDEGKDLNRPVLNKKRVGKFTKTGEQIAVYESAADAARAEGVLRDHISRVCRGERKTLYGFIWKYLD